VYLQFALGLYKLALRTLESVLPHILSQGTAINDNRFSASSSRVLSIDL
jgi:hypothetical protein